MQKTKQMTIASAFSGSACPLDVDCSAALQNRVADGSVHVEVEHALTYCTQLFKDSPLHPRGHAAAVRAFDEIKKLSASNKGATLFGGTLGSLNLHAFAIPGTLDLGRIRHALDNVKEAECLSDMLSVMQVNMDLCTHNDMQHLVRCHKDAEVVAACLVLYWHKDTKCLDEILMALSDLVFNARSMGTLSNFAIEKFKIVEKEDGDREVMGMSSYRKCLFVVDIAGEINAEKAFPDTGDEAQKLVKASGIAKGVLSTWNLDTMKRYL